VPKEIAKMPAWFDVALERRSVHGQADVFECGLIVHAMSCLFDFKNNKPATSRLRFGSPRPADQFVDDEGSYFHAMFSQPLERDVTAAF
jgi:hypothetical protein